MISFLCIAYLQSLSTPLLPNLQSKDLISKLNPPSSQCSLPVRRNHIGKETVDTTFVYIGVIPPLKEKLGWEQGTEADREFAREWVGKGKDSPPLTDLVRGFYFVYGGKARSMFDWDTGVVAVRYGGLRIRERVDGCLSWSKGSLVIQHPFVDTIVRTSPLYYLIYRSVVSESNSHPSFFLYAEPLRPGEGRTRPDRFHVCSLSGRRTPSRRRASP